MDDNGIRTHRKKSMSLSKSSLAAHKAISAIYLKGSRIYLYRFMRLNIDRITVYQSLFINKANVNRDSRNGMTCSIHYSYAHMIHQSYVILISGACSTLQISRRIGRQQSRTIFRLHIHCS